MCERICEEGTLNSGEGDSIMKKEEIMAIGISGAAWGSKKYSWHCSLYDEVTINAS